MPAPKIEHNQIAQNVKLLFGNALSGKPCRILGCDQRVRIEETGEYYYPDVVITCLDPQLVGFAVSRTRGRKPDLAVYLSGRRPPARGLIRMAPDIMVEVVSPRPRDGRRDRVEKTLEYAAFGVQYYWIVDPQLRSFEILARGEDGRYVHAVTASQGKVSDVPGCPGLEVDLDDLWKLVDELLVDDEHRGE